MNSVVFAEIREEHLPHVLDIYTHYILHSTATFHIHVLTIEEMREIVFFTDPRYRTYVIKDGALIIGYVILSKHKLREAYDATAEITIYLRPEYAGKGIGGQAISLMEEWAVKQKFHVIVSSICGQNLSSIKLFRKHGYVECAHYREVGYKFGQYLDVVVFQKILP
jgi:L-amino acid N-acyltransferase YncA